MYKTVEGRWGTCKFFAKDEYVGRSLYNYGEYNRDETDMIISLAGSGVCLDIGANIGVISQALSVTGHKVISFEPQPEVYKLLAENCPGVKCYNTAVGNTVGYVEMPKVQYSVKGNFGGLAIGDYSIYGNIDVPIVTIDDFELDTVSFMKIDVEGFELEVLKGATKTITRDHPIMYIEDDRSTKSRELRAYIESLGYEIEEHKPPLYSDENFFGLKKNVWDRNYASHNLICKYVNNK